MSAVASVAAEVVPVGGNFCGVGGASPRAPARAGPAGHLPPMDITDLGEDAFMEQFRFRLLAASEAHEEQVAETAEWLGISKSSYYRRRRGEMAFTAYEVVALSRRFGINILETGAPQFDFSVPLAADADFDEGRYLGQLEAAAATFPEPAATEVLASATDIPVFYLLADPDLAALKRYLFGLAIDASQARRFSLAVARREHAEFIHRAARVSRLYRATRREEAWGPSPLRSLLYQVLLLVESAALREEDCDAIFDAIEGVVGRLERSLVGAPAPGAPAAEAASPRLTLWQNRLHATSSIICVRSGSTGRLFVTFDNPNFFHAENPDAVAYFEAHFAALRRRSLPVGGPGGISPARYGQSLRAEVARGRERATRMYREAGEEF